MGLGLEILLIVWAVCGVWAICNIIRVKNRPPRNWTTDPWNDRDTAKWAATIGMAAGVHELHKRNKQRREQNRPSRTWAWDAQAKVAEEAKQNLAEQQRRDRESWGGL